MMQNIKRSVLACTKSRLFVLPKPQNVSSSSQLYDTGLSRFSYIAGGGARTRLMQRLPVLLNFAPARNDLAVAGHTLKDVLQSEEQFQVRLYSQLQLAEQNGKKYRSSISIRTFSSRSSDRKGKTDSETKKEISTIEDPFDAPTYNIPEKPVTFVEGASYSIFILIGLGIAAAAAYAVFNELIFQPKEYKIFNKALKRIQDDSQVRIRIGSPITGYGQESRNRAARQRIPHRVWTDEDGVDHIEVNFYVRGPHGAGKVFCRMFKDKVEKEWKFTSLVVQIVSPSPAQLLLESYVPA
ncbi:hypothetical protein SAY86_017810 [Trapa natans]|uniref:Mitochondrial import inner membrane translocase subunit Tim21 n=1 Tax=Trapa natans TaxID=22666 RepID=A0AAN7M5S2_TRANT|nr:hypothetical protein SAY86_017810 [Trapa natans]